MVEQRFPGLRHCTGQNTSERYWNPSQTFRLYVRKDVVYQIWEYGSSPGGLDLMVDEYAEGYLPLAAERTFINLGLNSPRGIAAGPDGSVYVADSNNNRILHLDHDGIIIGQVSGEGLEPSHLTSLGVGSRPGGLCLCR